MESAPPSLPAAVNCSPFLQPSRRPHSTTPNPPTSPPAPPLSRPRRPHAPDRSPASRDRSAPSPLLRHLMSRRALSQTPIDPVLPVASAHCRSARFAPPRHDPQPPARSLIVLPASRQSLPRRPWPRRQPPLFDKSPRATPANNPHSLSPRSRGSVQPGFRPVPRAVPHQSLRQFAGRHRTLQIPGLTLHAVPE
jgi:hypothetical protein